MNPIRKNYHKIYRATLQEKRTGRKEENNREEQRKQQVSAAKMNSIVPLNSITAQLGDTKLANRAVTGYGIVSSL